MSRSVGDLIAKQAGVVSAPHRAIHVLQPHNRVMVVASDGLWDWVPNEEAVSLGMSSSDTWESSTRLARLSRSRWLTRTGGADDTTIVVVRMALDMGGDKSNASTPSGPAPVIA
jgi:serine/threonine protein phosphatase PrpC